MQSNKICANVCPQGSLEELDFDHDRTEDLDPGEPLSPERVDGDGEGISILETFEAEGN